MQTFVGKSDTGCEICTVYFDSNSKDMKFFIRRAKLTRAEQGKEADIEYDYVHLKCALKEMGVPLRFYDPYAPLM